MTYCRLGWQTSIGVESRLGGSLYLMIRSDPPPSHRLDGLVEQVGKSHNANQQNFYPNQLTLQKICVTYYHQGLQTSIGVESMLGVLSGRYADDTI